VDSAPGAAAPAAVIRRLQRDEHCAEIERTLAISSVVRFSVPLTIRKTRSASRRRAAGASGRRGPLGLEGCRYGRCEGLTCLE
jgi:hypothetical protein